MSTKISYQWTKTEDMNIPNNNYDCETETIILQDGLDFRDYLSNLSIAFELDGITYHVLEDGERTGEAYIICSEEETDEGPTE